jgi:hypothetical protein
MINHKSLLPYFRTLQYIKLKNRKKQSIQHSNAAAINKYISLADTKKEAGKKQNRYLYTKNHLGEGFLDLSVTTSFIFGQNNPFKQQDNSRV